MGFAQRRSDRPLTRTGGVMTTGAVAPSVRKNAFNLGCGLLLAAANPWSGLTRQAARKGQWQPEHPFGLPGWWPYAPWSGRVVDLAQLELMQSTRRSEDSYPQIAVPNEQQDRR